VLAHPRGHRRFRLAEQLGLVQPLSDLRWIGRARAARR
jgi:hypothetical protein